MAEESEELSPENNDTITETRSNPEMDEDSDNINLFSSVWVKIEVPDDDDVQTLNENPLDQNLIKTKETTLRDSNGYRRRGSYKKSDPKFKSLKCDQCDYTTSHKSCLAFHILGHTNTKPFSCDQCDYKTKYPMSLKRHTSVKHDDGPKERVLPVFKCTDCPYESHFKWNLSSHQRKHDESKLHKCPHCNYSTAYKHSLKKHSRKHNKPEEMTYNCDQCSFTTKYEGHITRHLAKIHHVVSSKASRCDHCSFTSKTGWRLNMHKKRSRQDIPIRCVHCDYQSIYRCAFKEHKLTHTEGNQQWLESLFNSSQVKDSSTKEQQTLEIKKMCEIRSKIDDGNNESTIYNELKSKLTDDTTYYTFNHGNKIRSLPNVTQQSEHEKNNHYLVDPDCEVSWSNIQVIESPSQDRPFQCITCNYRAKFKASVQRHYQRHHTSQNRPYKCVNCDFSTKTKDQIALHNKRSRSDEILICKICSFTSVFKCQFVMHEKTHYPFKCVNCEYTCKKKPEMQKHFTIVHLGNGLKCSHCDFRATRKESLLCHEVIHTGRKPFQCQLCEYSSVRRSLLENHMTRFHQPLMVQEIMNDAKVESLKVTKL